MTCRTDHIAAFPEPKKRAKRSRSESSVWWQPVSEMCRNLGAQQTCCSAMSWIFSKGGLHNRSSLGASPLSVWKHVWVCRQPGLPAGTVSPSWLQSDSGCRRKRSRMKRRRSLYIGPPGRLRSRPNHDPKENEAVSVRNENHLTSKVTEGDISSCCYHKL